MSSELSSIAVLVVIILSGIVLAVDKFPAELVYAFSFSVLVFCNAINLETSIAGYSFEYILALVPLYVLSATLKTSGFLDSFSSTRVAQAFSSLTEVKIEIIILLVASFLSVFLDGTAILVLLLPFITSWLPSHLSKQLLLPLSYIITVIGSVTLISSPVSRQVASNAKNVIPLFDIALIALPVVFSTLIYLIIFSRRFFGVDESLTAKGDGEASVIKEETSNSASNLQINISSTKITALKLYVEKSSSINGSEAYSLSQFLQKYPSLKITNASRKGDEEFASSKDDAVLAGDILNVVGELAEIQIFLSFYQFSILLPYDENLEQQVLSLSSESNIKNTTLSPSVVVDLNVSPTASLISHDSTSSPSLVGIGGDATELNASMRLVPNIPLPFRTQLVAGSQLLVMQIHSGSELVGQSSFSVGFSKKYSSILLSIRRNSKFIESSDINNVSLQDGDELTFLKFEKLENEKEEFKFLSEISLDDDKTNVISKKVNSAHDSNKVEIGSKGAVAAFFASHWRVILTLISIITVLIINAVTLSNVPLLALGIAAVCILIGSGMISIEESKQAVDMQVIITAVGVMVFSIASTDSTLSSTIVQTLIEWATLSKTGEIGYIAAAYLSSLLLSLVLSNSQSALVVLSLVNDISNSNPKVSAAKLAYAVILGSSTSFITPYGNLLNIIVKSSGKYSFLDFVKFGAFLQLFVAVLSITAIYYSDVWYYAFILSLSSLLTVITYYVNPKREKEAKEEREAKLLSLSSAALNSVVVAPSSDASEGHKTRLNIAKSRFVKSFKSFRASI